MLITLKRHKAEIKALQDQIKDQDAPFTKACEILTRRGVNRGADGKYLNIGIMDYNKARKAVKNGN